MHRIFNYHGASIRYTDAGKGKNLVLLHGYLESLDVFEYFAQDLSQHCRVVVPDLPGHGKSNLINGECSMEVMADVVYGLAVHLGLDKIILAGHSMGGYAALAFAEKHPGMLAGFCLLHSTPNPDTEEKKENRQREIALVQQGKKELICSTSIPNMFADDNRKKFKTEIFRTIEIACRTSEEGIVEALKSMMLRPNRTAILKDLTVPKLSIIGKKDNFIPCKTALAIAKDTGMHPVVLKNSGHMGFVEQPEECLEEILKLLTPNKI